MFAFRVRWIEVVCGVCAAAMGAISGELTPIWTPDEEQEAMRDLIRTRKQAMDAVQVGSMIEVISPPPKNAVFNPNVAQHPTSRDCHIAEIESKGRIAWQKSSGYNQRSRGETLMGRWKTVIGSKLKARTFNNQKTEAKIGVPVLNRMTELGRPDFQRTA